MDEQQKNLPLLDDSAQNVSQTTDSEFKRFLKNEVGIKRNEYFDKIVEQGFPCYVALLVDDFSHKPKLFCGQVGEIESVELPYNNKNEYLVKFFNYETDEGLGYERLINKKNLLPLFDFGPSVYNTKITEIRNRWEEQEVHSILNWKLTGHKKTRSRFKKGHLVTVQFDFEQEATNGEKIVVQAGQIGIISHKFKLNEELRGNNVEVTFRSIPFGTLVENRTKIANAKAHELTSEVIGAPWEIKIFIKQDFLFPLYWQALE
jgi:hypothetical protein